MSDEKIIDIVRRAESGEYDIPEFQRQFVWKREQVTTLCDSLYKDFPIGTMLLWDVLTYGEPRVGEVGARRPVWVVDGQQRISSLCILFGRKAHWWDHEGWGQLYQRNRVYVKVGLDSENVITFGRIQKGENAVIVPVDEILRQEDEKGAITCIRQKIEEVGKPELFDRVVGPILKLRLLREQKVPVVTIGEDKTPEEVAAIYQRLNTQGTRIKQTDVMLAYIAAHNPGWVRTHFYPFTEDLEDMGWDIDPGHILQAVTVFTKGKARVGEVEREFWRSEVTQVWNKVKDAVEEALLRLWDSGITELDLVPSNYTLITLFALFARFKPSADSFREALRWFILANLAGRYGDAPLETLTNDAKHIFKAGSLSEALQGIQPTYSRDELRISLNAPFKKGSPPALLLYVLLWQRGARDWIEHLDIPTLTRAPRKLEPHWHHILPKGWAKRNSYEGTEQIANLTLICARTNIREFASKPPWEYARERIAIDSLRDHFIPDRFAAAFYTGQALSAQDFQRFLNERTDALAEAAAAYLGL